MNGWVIPVPDGSWLNGTQAIIGADGRYYGCEDSIGHPPGSYVSFLPETQDGHAFASGVANRDEPSRPQFDAYRDKIRAILSEKRFFHSLCVSKMCRAWAQIAGFSADRAEIAGLFHDIAKERPNEENIALIRRKGLPVAAFELQYHHLTHAYAGAILLEEQFGITDEEILSAVRYHSGKPDMRLLEKIVYLSDHIDKCVRLGVDLCFLYDGYTVDDAVLRSTAEVNRVFARAGKEADPVTEYTMNYLYRQRTQQAPSDEDPSFLPEAVFDRAVEIQLRNALGTKSVANARQIAGYRTADGSVIAGGRLFRSARLGALTEEDAGVLYRLGVRTIVDLRTNEETASCPDQNVGAFRREFCPLPAIELSDYQNDLAEKFLMTPVGAEKTFYLSEYLSCVDMQGMYEDILTEPGAMGTLRRVFALLADEASGGVLIHCTSGKDRTGIVAALLMFALGVQLPDVRDEYYASAAATFAATESLTQSLRRHGYSASLIGESRYLSGIGMNIAEGVFRSIVAEYGSMDGYLSLLLDGDTREALRRKYLVRKEI